MARPRERARVYPEHAPLEKRCRRCRKVRSRELYGAYWVKEFCYTVPVCNACKRLIARAKKLGCEVRDLTAKDRRFYHKCSDAEQARRKKARRDARREWRKTPEGKACEQERYRKAKEALGVEAWRERKRQESRKYYKRKKPT